MSLRHFSVTVYTAAHSGEVRPHPDAPFETFAYSEEDAVIQAVQRYKSVRIQSLHCGLPSDPLCMVNVVRLGPGEEKKV